MPFTTTKYDPATKQTTSLESDSAGGNIINSTSVASGTPVDPIPTPDATTPSPVTQYEPQLTTGEAQAETQQTDLSKMIADLSASTSAPFQQDAQLKAEDAQQVAQKKQSLASFQSIGKQLEAEAKGIQLQLQQDLQRNQLNNQLSFSGTGVSGGVSGIKGNQQARAIQSSSNQQLLSLSIKQYSNNASLAAASGDLASAMDFVDRAVQAEFLPKEKQLALAQANLTNLMNSRELTSAQQKRADARQMQLDTQREALMAQKKDAETMQGIILQAQQNGAPEALIQQARKGKTVFDVGQALTGWTAKETAQSIQEYNFAVKNGYKKSYTDYQNEDANRKIAIAKAGSAGGLSNPVLTRVLSVASQFDAEPIVKEYNTIQTQLQAVKNAGTSPTDDIQRVYAFAKVMDPNSVVREGEYSTVQAYSQAVLQAYGLKAARVFDNTGFLTPEARTFLLNTLENRFRSTEKSYNNIADEYGRRINKVGGITDGKDYITDYSGGYTPSVSGKGGLSDRQFIEKSVQSSGQSYDSILKLAKAGEIAVVNNQSGEIEFIPAESFSNSYTRL